jgi:hypothetical protein
MYRRLIIAVGCVLAAEAAFAQCPTSTTYPRTCDLANEPPYDPEARGSAYRKPSPSPCGVPSQYQAQIRAAFDCAPPGIKNDLLLLHTIYVLPESYQRTRGQSFGVWENTDQHSEGSSYVFLSRDVFDKSLSVLESAVQNEVQFETGNAQHALTYTVQPDSNALGLLSVIAHEAAHAKWFRDRVPNHADNDCFEQRFRSSWNRIPTRRWVGFAADGGADHATGPAGPGTQHPQHGLNEQEIHNLHRHFASVFGSISPEEDFVEVYKLIAVTPESNTYSVRTGPGPNQTTDVKARMTQGRLMLKVGCVTSLLPK